MRKIFAMVLALSLMVVAFAEGGESVNNGIGKVIPEEMQQAIEADEFAIQELSGCLGWSLEEFDGVWNSWVDDAGNRLTRKSNVTGKAVEYVDASGAVATAVNEIIITEQVGKAVNVQMHMNASLLGFRIGDTFSGLTDEMAAAGWEETRKLYEGDILYWTFTRTVGSAVYTFSVNAEPVGPISHLGLKVDDLAAHLANVEG